MIALVELVAQADDLMGYTTYVFKCLEDYMIEQSPYIMCTRFPNWEHRPIQLGEIGYLNCIEIRAGVDKWFNGKEFIFYNYDNVQFIKFIRKIDKNDEEYLM